MDALRQTLAYMSDDLRNLTQLDLQESKWPIRKRIFLVLFSMCRSLVEFNEELSRMVERREEEVGEQRAHNLPREQRKESEMYFRAQFMRVVCNGLESIRWPPALEAFADPLVDLMNDKKTFLNAVSFIIKVGGLGSMNSQRPSTPKARPSSATQRRQKEASSPPSAEGRRPTWDSSPVHPTGRDSGSGSVRNTPISSGSMEISHISDASSMKRMYGALGGKAGREPFSNIEDTRDYRDRDGSSAGGATTPRQEAGGDDPATIKSLRVALESLQGQNMTLSRQLKMAHEATARREKSERSLELIIAQLVQVVGQVASLTGGSSGGSNADVNIPSVSSYVEEAAVEPSFVTEAEDEMFRREVAREDEERADRERDRKGLKVGGRGVSVHSGGGSGGTATASSDRDKKGGKKRPVPSHSTSTSASTSASPSGTEHKVTSALLWRQTLDNLQAVRAQWTAAVRDARSSFVEPLALQREESREFLRKAKGGSSPGAGAGAGAGAMRDRSGPAAIRMHRLLGVARPLSFPYSSLEEGQGQGDDSAGDAGLWLDLSRVQQLQSDLLSFAEEAAAFSKALAVPDSFAAEAGAALGHTPRERAPGPRRAVKKGGRGGKKKKKEGDAGAKRRVGSSVFGPTADVTASADLSVASSGSPRGVDGAESDSSSLSDYTGVAAHRHGAGAGSGGGRGGPDLFLLSPKDGIRASYSRALAHRAAELTLHLSAFAPLAPLALHRPRSSHLSGLECLVKECHSLLDGGSASGRHISKRTGRAILEASDRARSESGALVRALDAAEAEIAAYRRLASSLQPLFATFSDNAAGILHDTWEGVSQALTGVDEIVCALDRAEASRVGASALAGLKSLDHADQHSTMHEVSSFGTGGSSSSSSATTSTNKRGSRALDALSDGCLGGDVAALVVSLRRNGAVLRDLQRSLFGAKKSLHASAVRELSSLHAAKEKLRRRVLLEQEQEQERERERGQITTESGGKAGRDELDDDDGDILSFVSPRGGLDLPAPEPTSAEKSPRPPMRGGGTPGARKPSRLEDRPPFEV